MADPYRDIAFSLDEAFRHLPYALRGFDPVNDGPWRVVASAAGGRHVTIQGDPLPPRQLSALISLPRCRIGFAFQGFTDEEQAAFLANFDRAFQRGGG